MLAKAADYVLENGLAGLSLRPLAQAIGTSTRMLLYDFETKEQLVDEILAEIRRREAELLVERTEEMTLADVWGWISAKEREPFLRLFFATYADAIAHPDRHVDAGRPMVRDWLEFLGSRWRPGPLDPEAATLFVAVIRGLLLDRLTASDPDRTDRALARFEELVGGVANA